jgi:hypothetical protein
LEPSEAFRQPKLRIRRKKRMLVFIRIVVFLGFTDYGLLTPDGGDAYVRGGISLNFLQKSW